MGLKPIEHSFTMKYSYGLYFTDRVFNIENPIFSDVIAAERSGNPSKLLFIIDEGLLNEHPYLEKDIRKHAELHGEIIEITDLIKLPGGEAVKNNPQFVNQILAEIERCKICRHSYVVAIGGGALIDLVGYAASIAHRGVRLIRIPTTVLSQNDAAVGVKNGVNIFGKKNFIGTFEPPFAVINDSFFLTTLEDRDWIAGIAEAIKVALIKDEKFYRFIRKHLKLLKDRDQETMQAVIYRCAELHMEHIAHGGDPFEKGSSRPLDFGHWSAHKLEYMSNYELRHGEAVAKGMALDLLYSSKMGILPSSKADDIIELLAELGFDLKIPLKTDNELNTLLSGIEEFREHLGGQLTITLIEDIGKKIDVHEIDLKTMKDAIKTLNSLPILNPA